MVVNVYKNSLCPVPAILLDNLTEHIPMGAVTIIASLCEALKSTFPATITLLATCCAPGALFTVSTTSSFVETMSAASSAPTTSASLGTTMPLQSPSQPTTVYSLPTTTSPKLTTLPSSSTSKSFHCLLRVFVWILSVLQVLHSPAAVLSSPLPTSAAWSVFGSLAYTAEPTRFAAVPSTVYKDHPRSLSPEWPGPERWVPFDVMWARQKDNYGLGTNCEVFGLRVNTNTENADLRAALVANARRHLVDPRMLLAVALQHSYACVRMQETKDTGWGAKRYGIMGSFGAPEWAGSQCINGSASIAPCDASTVGLMVDDGARCLANIVNSIQASDQSTAMWYALGQYYGGPQFSLTKVETYYWLNNIYNTLSGWVFIPGSGI